MESVLLYLIIILWLPSLFIFMRNSFADIKFWQAKEYRFDRLWTHLRYDFEPTRQNPKLLIAKLILFFTLSSIVLAPSNLLLTLAVFGTYLIYSWETALFIEQLIRNTGAAPRWNIRAVVILLVNFFIALTIIFIISFPILVVDVISGYEKVLLWPNVFTTNVLTLPDLLLYIIISAMCMIAIDLSSFLLTSIGVIVTYPIHFAKNLVIKRTATTIINSLDKLKVVGITGNYGKTITAEIAYQLLKDKFNTIKSDFTQTNIDGISDSVINLLTPDTEVFLVEIGAYEPGNIKEVAKMLKPQIGLVTNVEYSHIGIHQNQTEMYKIKYELIENLKEGGTAILNGDDEHCLKMAGKNPGNEILYFTSDKFERIKNNSEKVEPLLLNALKAENIRLEEGKLVFDLVTLNQTLPITTSLSDKHLATSVLAAISIAIALGLGLDEIAVKLADMAPRLNRLAILQGDNNTLIIDDTGESHFSGFKNALEKLKTTEGNSKVLITKGIYELGKHKEEVYEKLSDNFVGIDVLITQDKKLLKVIKKHHPAIQVIYAATHDDMLYQARANVSANDVILLEGNIPEKVFEALLSEN